MVDYRLLMFHIMFLTGSWKATFTALAYLGHLFVRYLRIWVIWLTSFIGQDDECSRKILASLRGQGGGYYQQLKNAQ